MDRITLIKQMVAEYQTMLPAYTVMQRYYCGDHDIVYKVWSNPKRCNKICIENFISKFVDEEVNMFWVIPSVLYQNREILILSGRLKQTCSTGRQTIIRL